MRYADSSASQGYDRPLLKLLLMAFEDGFDRFDALGSSNIGQEYHSCVGDPSQVNQLSEVLVDCDEDALPPSASAPLQQRSVAWVRAEVLRLNHVVAVTGQPFR